MITVSLDTLATIATLLVAIGGLYAALRRDLDKLDQKFDQRIDALDQKFDQKIDQKVDGLRAELKDDYRHLDDRIYALGVGLRPLIEQAQAAAIDRG